MNTFVYQSSTNNPRYSDANEIRKEGQIGFLRVVLKIIRFLVFIIIPFNLLLHHHHHHNPECSSTRRQLLLGYQSIASGCVSGFTWEVSVQMNQMGRGEVCTQAHTARKKQAKKEQKTEVNTGNPSSHCPNPALIQHPHPYLSPSFVSIDQIKGQA